MTVKELRERAEGIRMIAGFAQSDECRSLLLRTASTYEKMANDKAIEGRSGLPHWLEQQELRQLLDVSA